MKSWLLVASLLLLLGNPALAEKQKPNILLIMADDLGIEGLECYGGTSYKTPYLNQMAKDGIRFTHAYSQPLCTPTRVQIMTGKYNQRNWLYFGILDPKEKTFGHLMKDAGYKTCISGKWQLQSYDPPDFPNADKRRSTGMKVADAGFDEYSLFHSWHTEDKGSRYADPSFDENGTLKTVEGGYGPDTSVDFILDFMKKNQSDPMFVYYAMSLPHWPMVPTPDSKAWQDQSRRLEESTDYFPDMVNYMDKLVGRLQYGIRSLNLQNDTLVLFYSDNGTDARINSKMGEISIQGGKATPQQSGIRVPLIASWTGTIKPGQTTNQLIDASDFLPTLADLAGVKIPGNWDTDGISFAPRLLGKSGKQRETAFFWYDPRPGWDKAKFSRHVFALDHKYKLFADGRLFDIEGLGLRDIYISNNQMTPEVIAAKKKLQAVIDNKMQEPISDSAKKLVDAYGNAIK